MKQLELRALKASTDYVNKFSKNCKLEIDYDSTCGVKIKLKRYSGNPHEPLILEGKVIIQEEKVCEISGSNENFVNYIKEKLK